MTTSDRPVGASTISEPKMVKAIILGAMIVGLGFAFLFRSYPELDLTVSRVLYLPDHHFIGSPSPAFSGARMLFNVLFYGVCVLAVVGCAMTHSTGRPWLKISSGKWLYLAVCILAGPLVITNLGFKDHWGRARPHSVVEFGGNKSFSPPLIESQQCEKNCSFVSGEASAIYIVCFAAAFLFPSFSGSWVLTGVVLGSAAGFVRMAQGAHFLSDVIFAGVLMALTAAAVQLVFATLTGNSEPR
jgi:lipid A 4'-phosphatase